MKIIHITPSFFPAKGGVETHVWQVSQVLVRLGYEVQVLTLSPKNLKLRFLRLKLDKKGGLKFKDVTPDLPTPARNATSSSFAHKLSLWRQVLALRSHLTSADVIQVHDVAWWLLPLWPFFRRKIFITFHGWEGIYPVPKKNIYQRRFFSRLAKGVVHVGAFIQKFYGDTPDLVVYGGADKVNSKFKIKNLKFKINNVVFVGRLEEENEIKKYFDLAKLLKKSYPEVKITWVGDGKYRQQAQKFGQVAGMVDQDDLKTYLKSADLVFAGSYLSILQALAYGKLVVAFYSHTLKESYLKDSPMAKYMLVSDSPKQVVSWLMKETALPDLDQAHKWAKKQTWEKVAKGYLRLYAK